MSWSILSLPLRIYIFLHSIALCLSTQSSSNANILILQRCHSFSHHITSNYWEALSTFGLEKIYSSFMIPLNIQLIQTGKNYAFFSFFFYSQSPLLPSEMASPSSVSPLYLVRMFWLALAMLSVTQEAKSMLFVLASEATRRHVNNKLNKRNESKTSSYLF